MHRLSVVIPTRERGDTLCHTIRTLIQQESEDFEILVSDNASKDNTRNIVAAISDPRVRYINTNSRISMSENWEFALNAAKGDYITFLGDDDGFLPGSVSRLLQLIDQCRQPPALVWEKAEYHWPDHVDTQRRNWFSVINKQPELIKITSRKQLRKTLTFRASYQRLPCLYNGAIRRSLIEAVKEMNKDGLFFNSISPDVFSGIVLATQIDSYCFTDFPLSLNGASRHSNGTSFMKNQASDARSPAAQFMSENQIEYDERLMMAPSISLCIMGELLLATEAFPKITFPNPEWRAYLTSLARNASKSPHRDAIVRSMLHTASRVEIDAPRIDDSAVKHVEHPPLVGGKEDGFTFKAPTSMVNNIFDACQLLAGMLPDGPAIPSAPALTTSMRSIARAVRSEFRKQLLRWSN